MKYNPLLKYGFQEVGGIGVDYPTGYYMDFLPIYSNTSTQSLSANVFHGLIVRIKQDIEISASMVRVGAAAIGGGTIGIYKYNELTGDWENSCYVDGFDLAVTGDQILSYGSNIKLNAGIYATGFLIQSTATMGSKNVTSQELIFGNNSLTSAGLYNNKMQFNYTYDGTLPNIAPSPTILASNLLNPATLHLIV